MRNEFDPSDELLRSTDHFLAQVDARMARRARRAVPTIIVGGAVRCGKTTVARIVAKKFRMLRVSSDQIQGKLCRGRPRLEQVWTMGHVLRTLLGRYPNCMLLEGKAFSSPTRDTLLWTQTEGRAIPVFLIGCTGDAQAKAEAIRQFREGNACWTSSKTSDEDLLELAQQVTEESRANKILCADLPGVFHDISSGKFGEDTTQASIKICAHLTAAEDRQATRLARRRARQMRQQPQ